MKNKKYLLDTNILIEFMWGTPTIVSKIIQTGFDKCCISTISLHELYYGAYNAKKKSERCFREEIARIEKLLTKLTVLPLGTNGEIYGNIKYSLEKKGLIIDEFDMVIASHAISEGLTVVTDNLKHFSRIEGLKVENWMEH
ncbi:MAG: type II toxin-antitoxin system VapC family toxin [Bacteroidales bacterium]|nr:type II toxin-antitoxin system VapC family toxin [Bacteroidales bacterium]